MWKFIMLAGMLLSLPAFSQRPSDPAATAETRNLYINLIRSSKTGVLFGHQDDLVTGYRGKKEDGRSDIYDLVGEYPAVFGWELGKIEVDTVQNVDKVRFSKIAYYVRKAYSMGGINTFVWHCNNPVLPDEGVKTTKIDSTIKRLFADPVALERYRGWLDRVANYLGSLRGPKGEQIPIIFRPFHEHTGEWFWWGQTHCTADEFIRLWRFTVDYLRDTKNLHNLLYAYSPDMFATKEGYLRRYPGDAYVDILGFDYYDKASNHPGGTAFVDEARRRIGIIRGIGQEKGKPWALTEAGLYFVSVSDWWTNTLNPIIKDSGLSYVLIWRNSDTTSYWGVYPGQKSADDFQRMYRNKDMLFRNPSKNFYKR
ncbi:glycoside hydrolase family 26 protein [Siphonobacter aquaeclarae]|uniref:Mannan endo-1,4-beta-mannosidase n=1 Tax=Siphonobacter aquaeclarae TaxID=563176 RepID=A0A1G9V7C2_9BACT|nr:glycosyl hydrolase [Siphonobacter aquaeclarae]SDM68061.1 mannan endo-1,4-beta-mannosidase [Siphonobacter aquaeclarae]